MNRPPFVFYKRTDGAPGNVEPGSAEGTYPLLDTPIICDSLKTGIY
jgi:hypothetical protein